jgi:hypothetical protein
VAVHEWIDTLVNQWGTIRHGKKNVRAFLVHKKSEYPEALRADDFPVAITYIRTTSGIYAAGGAWEYTYGITEFHITPTADRSLYGQVLEWIPLIRNKLFESITLGGLISNIDLVPGEGEGSGIYGPVELQYQGTEEPPHWGYVVNWVAKEQLTDVSVGA